MKGTCFKLAHEHPHLETVIEFYFLGIKKENIVMKF